MHPLHVRLNPKQRSALKKKFTGPQPRDAASKKLELKRLP